VGRMFTASFAEFLLFKLIRRLLLVFGRTVVPTLTSSTL
jgi:hypothetical protein